MSNTRRLWIGLAVLLIGSFAVLLLMGNQINEHAPPVPDRVVSSDGSMIYSRDDIRRGRQVWQSIGGMQLGSIWGHGGYVAPDWSADWLHREAIALLDQWAQTGYGASYEQLREGVLHDRELAPLRGELSDARKRTTIV